MRSSGSAKSRGREGTRRRGTCDRRSVCRFHTGSDTWTRSADGIAPAARGNAVSQIGQLRAVAQRPQHAHVLAVRSFARIARPGLEPTEHPIQAQRRRPHTTDATTPRLGIRQLTEIPRRWASDSTNHAGFPRHAPNADAETPPHPNCGCPCATHCYRCITTSSRPNNALATTLRAASRILSSPSAALWSPCCR